MNEAIKETTDAGEGISAPSGWSDLKNVPFSPGEQAPRQFVKFGELSNICNLDNCILSGHGAVDSKSVEKIFEQGLKGYNRQLRDERDAHNKEEVIGSTELNDNTIALFSSPEQQFTAEEATKIENEYFKDWPHLHAKNILLIRLPKEYFLKNATVDNAAQPFFRVQEDERSVKCNYLDRRFILGNYDAETNLVEINPHFESEIKGDFKAEMDARRDELQAECDNAKKLPDNFGLLGSQSPEPRPKASVKDPTEDDPFAAWR